MFFPLGDDNPTQRRPVVNYILIALNVAAFLLTLGTRHPDTVIRWTMVPADLHWPTLFTNIFLHANWIHLLGNMWMLWIFGDNVEDRLGRLGYAVFYLACGLAADAAHIVSNASSDIPTLGASGAIAGVMGAYIWFFPQQRVKTLVFFGFFFDFWHIPAFVWIGIWFLEQLFLSTRGLAGGVAYMAHIGGFIAGLAIAALIRGMAAHWPSRRWSAPLEASTPERRLFTPIPDDPGIEFMDEPGDGYSVLRLTDDPSDVARIAPVVASLTKEPPTEVIERLQATQGMIARAIPVEAANQIQRELHVLGIPSAKILHNRSNLPPRPIPVESTNWDDRTLRLRAGEHIVMVPWSAPFLFVGARIDGIPFIEIFVNRRTAYRINDARHIPLTEVDPVSRKEGATDLAGLARAVLDRAAGSTNDGVRDLAGARDGGRLDFRSAADYDDYVFWLYNLILAKGIPSTRG
jgi:membrane associated rhomboid family serine protease